VLAGAAAFAYGILAGDRSRAWSALLANFLFWSGLAHAGVLLAALQTATSARWGRALKRMAEATSAFLPAAFVVLVVLLAGASGWAPWAASHDEARAAWLNVPFLAVRQMLAFLVLSGLCVAYVYHSVRADLGLIAETSRGGAAAWHDRVTAGWRGLAAERASSVAGQQWLAPAIFVVYAIALSLQGFDFVMALDPHWFSTLMGGYFFMGGAYAAIAFLAVVAIWGRARSRLDGWIGPSQLEDLGKLLFGFSIMWAYLAWSQYLVIWFGDLPEETGFISRRMVEQPWAPFAWTVLAAGFVVPFVVLLSRSVKRRPGGLLAIALLVFLGMWLERFVLVAPSLQPAGAAPFGLLELLITAGFTAAFALSYLAFLRAVPVMPISDLLLAPVAAQGAPHP
jgi:hypothetical protein